MLPSLFVLVAEWVWLTTCCKIALVCYPSAKLVLTIKHKPGKANENAGTLSRNPIGVGLVGLVETESSGKNCISDLVVVRREWSEDTKLGPAMRYLMISILPLDQDLARMVMFESKQFSLLDGVLHLEDRMHSG